MIPNDALINALRSLKYEYKTQADRTLLYKQRGTANRVSVRRVDMHDDKAARATLRLAGMSEAEIERFIAAYRIPEA